MDSRRFETMTTETAELAPGVFATPFPKLSFGGKGVGTIPGNRCGPSGGRQGGATDLTTVLLGCLGIEMLLNCLEC